jgi:hypothetical protein
MGKALTDSERLKKLIEYSGLSGNAFAKSIGYESGQTVYNILNYGRPINMHFALNVLNKYETIRLNWLLTGKGEMFDFNNENEQIFGGNHLQLEDDSSESEEPEAKSNEESLPEKSLTWKETIDKALEIIQSQQEAISKLSDAALIHARNIEKLLENKHQPGTNHDRIAG